MGSGKPEDSDPCVNPLDPKDFGIDDDTPASFTGNREWMYTDNCSEVTDYMMEFTYDEIGMVDCVLFALPQVKTFRKPIKRRHCDLNLVKQYFEKGICREQSVQFLRRITVSVDTSITSELIKTYTYMPGFSEPLTSFGFWECIASFFTGIAVGVSEALRVNPFYVGIGTSGVTAGFLSNPPLIGSKRDTIVTLPTGETVEIDYKVRIATTDEEAAYIEEKEQDDKLVLIAPTTSPKPIKVTVLLMTPEETAKVDANLLAPNEIKLENPITITTALSAGGTAVWLHLGFSYRYDVEIDKYKRLIDHVVSIKNGDSMISCSELLGLLSSKTLGQELSQLNTGFNLGQGTFDYITIGQFKYMLDDQIKSGAASYKSWIDLNLLKDSIGSGWKAGMGFQYKITINRKYF